MRLEDYTPDYRETIDGKRYAVALMVPSPELTGSILDESNLATVEGNDAAVSLTVGHWTYRHYSVVLLPESDALDIRAALEDYPVLDESDYSMREYDAFCDAATGLLTDSGYCKECADGILVEYLDVADSISYDADSYTAIMECLRFAREEWRADCADCEVSE